MNSKALCIFITLIFLALSAAAAFQYLEMQDYDLIDTLKERYFPAEGGSADQAETTTTEESE